MKNSNMFAREQKQEYDPASAPLVERPLASGRALNAPSNNTWGRPSDASRSDVLKSPSTNGVKSPEPATAALELSRSPGPKHSSPTKSSLSRNSRYGHIFDPESGTWSEDEETSVHELPAGKTLRRHPKSVTFDAAPPQVNEYEMTTPDPSSVASGSREGSYDSVGDDDDDDDEGFTFQTSGNADDSFDASLEDTDKTPVVLPEDWRFMSPDKANDDLASTFEDPFETRKPSPTDTIQPQTLENFSPSRSNSRSSDGDSRPLPPLPPPPAIGATRERSSSNSSLQAMAERVATSPRNLLSPPRPASISKSELQGMGTSGMSLEDRLRLMMLQGEEKSPRVKSPADEQRERRMRRAGASPDRTFDKYGAGFRIHEDGEAESGELESGLQFPQMIKRESILRKIKSQSRSEDYAYSSPLRSPTPEAAFGTSVLDPDVPIPSMEDRSPPLIADDGKVIKQEDEESEVDQYAIPEMYRHVLPSSTAGSDNAHFEDDDDGSHYSTDIDGEPAVNNTFVMEEGEAPPTPRASELQKQATLEEKEQHRMSLPQFAAMLGREDFSHSFSHYITPSPPVQEPGRKDQGRASTSILDGPTFPRPSTPTEQMDRFSDEEDQESTPGSVIRHPIGGKYDEEDAPTVPEPSATIKAPGGGLKTRPSLAPADFQTMAETRRKVSGDQPPPPAIPERHQKRPSVIPEGDSFFEGSGQSAQFPDGKQPKRKSSLVQLEVPVENVNEDLSLGLDKEFDRLLEAQKVPYTHFLQHASQDVERHMCTNEDENFVDLFANLSFRKQKGYLMRQNTKLVVASSGSHDSSNDKSEAPKLNPRATKSAGNSPVKSSATWTTEPWNGRIRRKSIRQSGGSPMKRPGLASGPVPPLPGMASNVSSDLETAGAEPDTLPEVEEFEDGAERGRLFVKVVGVKDLDLPLPRGKESVKVLDTSADEATGERSYFCLTLDNGLHCVTTSWLELGKNAPIGQEFELVVLNDLEFQLTLATKIEEPKPVKPIESPSKVPKLKQSAFSRVFASPKKRKELELKQQEEAARIARQKQAEAEAARRRQPSAWDLLHNLVNKDGSFARAYISLKDHETRAYGRPYTVDIPCFNEWAVEEARKMGSSKSGRSMVNGMQRRAPYKIAKLELQLLYVPKPKEATDDDMPKSMNACVRELHDAEKATHTRWEGHLSQQGGDCPVSLSLTQAKSYTNRSSIGGVASSASRGPSSRHTTKPLGSLARPSTSPKPASWSTTSPRSCRRR